MTLTFLGTADSKGVPRFWCACPVCQEARTGGVNRRRRTALLLRGEGQTVLLDAGVDLHTQLAGLSGPLLPDAVLISHAHNDHILGLGDLLDFERYEGGNLAIYAPPPVIPHLAERFGYAFGEGSPVLPMPPNGVQFAGFNIRLFGVPHGANGSSHAYRLDCPGFRAALVTDALDIPARVAQEWLTDLDLLALGTSFADESACERGRRSVYDIREALALPWARAARRVVLTHLSHAVDVRRLELPDGWAFASDGLSLDLK
ncbi:MBL fold metallo-hydrolase [Deinococcus sp.]|uniref:MBL fold metallo-hydrolase n=1 Tax=Deinococcus sp. TaxID=47478 RepID=UPI0025BBB34D|nr:MBL fold metallo-hydrolase [Deinococcus sp.]